MNDDFKGFEVIMNLNFVNSITSALEDVIFEKFECDEHYIGAYLIERNGLVTIVAQSRVCAQEEAEFEVKNRLSDIMFDISSEEMK